MEDSKGFIEQTANDYDMSESAVQYIYDKHFKSGEFYSKLEEYIQIRANQ